MRLLDLRFPSPSELRAVFGFSHPRTSQVALTVRLNADGYDKEKVFDEVIKIIEVVRYCHDYEHCQECSWQQLTAIVNRCRDSVPVAFGATAVSVKIRDRVIDDLTEDDVFLKKNLFNVEPGSHDGLPVAYFAASR
jgi:hypothetical protein